MNRGRVQTGYVLAVALLTFMVKTPSSAQFSPGPLSAAHSRLEGPTNCTTCHEVGKEIAGSKCLECHREIRGLLERKTGYHAVSAIRQECIACHKEHLGVDAKTYLFDPEKFDHDLTGFTLSGKHGKISCADCHIGKFIRDPLVKDLLAKHSRQTYLGLVSRCADCHADVHKGKFGPECSTCHRSSGWKEVGSFDHSRTKFQLVGKHAGVSCDKCHKPGGAEGGKKFGPMPPETYTDCTPCHASPHRAGAVNGACTTCHDAAGWKKSLEKPFDHGRTRYPLEGAHAKVKCLSCHAMAPGRTFDAVFLRSFGRCADCHEDRHDGAFVKSYGNDCAPCHTVRAYSPSTFTFGRHQKTSWPLTGGHMATLCIDCHRKGPAGMPWNFRMKDPRCEACHADVHKGQFAPQMKQGGCSSCHSTAGWKGTAFAHDKLTSFPLEGKHAAIRCEACHKEITSRPAGEVKYKKLPATCESCHKDEHRGQFAAAGKTECARCHPAAGWTRLIFDHDKQSGFSLSGAHARVKCAACHLRETADGVQFTRYKPLAAACESCHQKKDSR